jgi:hypothetical protein
LEENAVSIFRAEVTKLEIEDLYRVRGRKADKKGLC